MRFGPLLVALCVAVAPATVIAGDEERLRDPFAPGGAAERAHKLHEEGRLAEEFGVLLSAYRAIAGTMRFVRLPIRVVTTPPCKDIWINGCRHGPSPRTTWFQGREVLAETKLWVEVREPGGAILWSALLDPGTFHDLRLDVTGAQPVDPVTTVADAPVQAWLSSVRATSPTLPALDEERSAGPAWRTATLAAYEA